MATRTIEELEGIGVLLSQAARVNVAFQKIVLPHKPFEQQPQKSRCTAKSSPFQIHDVIYNETMSAHERLQMHALSTERNALLKEICERLTALPFIYSEDPGLIVTLALSEASGPTVEMRIGSLSVHPRPITPANFMKRLTELAECLEPFPSLGPRRQWFVSNQMLFADSPEAALWQYLSFHHRPQVLKLVRSDDPSGAITRRVQEYMSFRTFSEMFDTAAQFENALEKI